MAVDSVYNDRCSRCGVLHSLAVEIVIVIVTILHVMASLTEQLVHLEVIQVPGHSDVVESDGSSVSTTAPPHNNSSIDPGGAAAGDGDERCGYTPSHHNLRVLVEVLRYFTLVVSGLFTVEIICKVIYNKLEFFKDFWMIFDMLVVLFSLGAEIAFFQLHDKVLCFHLAVEVCSYVIILRLWRVPRACSIRKEEYVEHLDNEMTYLRKTKHETDMALREMQIKYKQQTIEVEQLRLQLSKHGGDSKQNSAMHNGSGPPHGFSKVIQNTVLKTKDQSSNSNGVFANGHVPRANGTSPGYSDHVNDSPGSRRLNAVDTSDGGGRLSPCVVPNDDVFMDSDGSESPVHVQEVEVQIEEAKHQKQLPSISKSVEEESAEEVMMRQKAGASVGYNNDGYENEDDKGTYRSADGIPTTEL